MQLNNSLLPWLRKDWRELAQRKADNRLPHALLISGNAGIGKSSFAEFAAQSFLCNAAEEQNHCAICESCMLFSAATHPDYLVLAPAQGKQVIGIDQVRAMIDKLALTPQCSQRKVAIIDPADTMNPQAANCLLKTLEEPAVLDLIMLISSVPGLLPSTIRSRCQKLHLTVDSRANVKSWLQEQGVGNVDECIDIIPAAPLKAFQLADGSKQADRQQILDKLLAVIEGRDCVSQFVSNYASVDSREILELFSNWIAQSIKHKMHCSMGLTVDHEISRIEMLVKAFSIVDLFNIYNKIQNLRIINNSSFKTRTVLEGLLADMRLIHLK